MKDIDSDNSEAIKKWDKCNARYLVHPVKQMLGGEETTKCTVASKESMMDVDVCLKAFQHRAARLLVELSQQIQGDVMEGKSFESAWNAGSIQMGRVTRAHSLYLLLHNFVNGIDNESKAVPSVIGPNEVDVLKDLALLFGLYWIQLEDGEFLADGYLSAQHIKWVRSCVLTMLDKIRPNAVALVDANDFSDFRLKSALGRFDGNVYEAILESSKKDPLNGTEPGPGYEEHLKRLIVDGVGAYSGTLSRL